MTHPPHRARTVVLLVVWWLVWSGIGVLLIAAPDSGPRVLSFSGAHGPGVVDLAGVVAACVGNAAPWWYIARHRARVAALPTAARGVLWFTAGVGTGLVIASVFADFAAWWAVGTAAIVALQVTMFAVVCRR